MDSPKFTAMASVARKLGIDPGVLATEPDPWVNAARYAAAIIYNNADEKAEQEQKAQART